MEIIYFAPPSTGGNFLIEIIKWLIQISSSIAVGVILFTVLLKLITLPFDFMSRFSMRKNSLKMEQMRPELEKLQKQYANDKQLYNQKMMNLYKKNGYSMWGACLPTIITLVIFIVSINAFTAYSEYQNREYFYNMSKSYNAVIYEGIKHDDDLITLKDGVYEFNYEKIVNVYENEVQQKINNEYESNGIVYLLEKEDDGSNVKYSIYNENGYSKFTFDYNNGIASPLRCSIIPNNLVGDQAFKSAVNNNLTVIRDGQPESFAGTTDEEAIAFLQEICQDKSAETFRSINSNFLWVKNIWVTDSPTAHSVLSDWEAFKNTYKYDISAEKTGQGMTEANYKNLVAKLEFEKTAPNGYYILAILTAVVSFLSQFIMNKSQKAQMELQTVDGQGAKTQKMMMWLMPIMMAVFAFLYTAAFSIYMIISQVIGILTTLLINWIADKKFKKEIKNNTPETIRGRVHEPTEEEIAKSKEKTKKNKEKENVKGDFITGSVNPKRVRGRLK